MPPALYRIRCRATHPASAQRRQAQADVERVDAPAHLALSRALQLAEAVLPRSHPLRTAIEADLKLANAALGGAPDEEDEEDAELDAFDASAKGGRGDGEQASRRGGVGRSLDGGMRAMPPARELGKSVDRSRSLGRASSSSVLLETSSSISSSSSSRSIVMSVSGSSS